MNGWFVYLLGVTLIVVIGAAWWIKRRSRRDLDIRPGTVIGGLKLIQLEEGQFRWVRVGSKLDPDSETSN